MADHHQTPSSDATARAHPPPAPLRVAVLTASYAETTCELKSIESAFETEPPPGLFFAPRWPPAKFPHLLPDPEAAAPRFQFEVILVHKRTAYGQVRDAVKSGKYDCFFNLCDGAKDEARAGVEVLEALEEFGAPYTGACSRYFEPSKTEMKRAAHYHGIRIARGCVMDKAADVRAKSARLTFPVIVKHVSGYSSIGMTKDAKCRTVEELEAFVAKFTARFGTALVEEFVEGDEVTVLACADPSSPDGVRVYPPVQMNMPAGEDFKHFDLKWGDCDAMSWFPMSPQDPAYDQVMRIARDGFKHVLGGVGYGRSDIRINRTTNEAVFLEINPNCGIFYPYGEEGSADWVLRYAGANGQGHRDFVKLQIETAMARVNGSGKWPATFDCVLDDSTDQFMLEATRDIPEGCEVLRNSNVNKLYVDERVPIPTTTSASAGADEDSGEIVWPGSPLEAGRPFAVAWGNEDRWGGIPNSCRANLRFVGGRRRVAVAARRIAAGERLTIDYREMYVGMPRATALMVPTPCVVPGDHQHHRWEQCTLSSSCQAAATTTDASGIRPVNVDTMSSPVEVSKAVALADEASASSGRTSPMQQVAMTST